MATLSRDAAGANDSISPIFNKEKEQQRLQMAQLIGEVGAQAGDIARTQGDINGLEKAKADNKNIKVPDANASEKDRENYLAKLRATPTYKNEMLNWGTGSAVQQGIQAATAAIQGLAGGNIGQAISGAASPYLAEQIHKLTEGNPEAQAMAHAVVGAVVAQASGNSALAGAAGAVSGELMAKLVMEQLYPGKKVSELTETEKQTISALGTLAAGLAGGVAGDSTAGAVAGAQAGKNAVENNFLSNTDSDKLDKAVEKIKQGDKSLAAANELITLENADKRSDALVSKFTKDPSQMSSTERAELAGYLRIYAAEMEKEYGPAVPQELVKGLLSGQDYIKRNPDSEAMRKAQSIINTWGYHKSNASIGDAPLIFGGSVLGLTVKGMAANAAIGVGVNAGVQLAGKDPFSYVDVIMAGITSAATTGKGIIASAPINMGGAAVSSGVKGENPVNSMAGAAAGTVVGGIGGEIIKGATSKLGKDAISDLTGAILGGYISEKTGNTVKDNLDENDKANAKK
ncbi:adhesin/hemagglutinin [Erwinia mallotivora]|uniref:Adhesin/hemagglutinin n=1 Tax=Erwinia mallotivora TaxID=69222 RepID=A0A014M7J9_9GAMM|nr:adhesin/hemagglutinin [Erwinia mallotivora]